MLQAKSLNDNTGAVLYLRVNSFDEVAVTTSQVDSLRELFPSRPIYTLVSKVHEAREQILRDRRFDLVLDFPEPSSTIRRGNLLSLVRFLRKHKIETTVVSFGSTDRSDYSKTVLVSILFPGKWLLLGPDLKLTSLSSPTAWRVYLQSIFQLFYKSLYAVYEIVSRKIAAIVLRNTYYRKLTEQELECVKSILWIRLDHIGDLVMSLAALLALRDRFPDARIDVLTQSSNMTLLDNVEGINNVYVFDPKRHRSKSERKSSFYDRLSLVFRLRSAGYDLAVDSRGDDSARKIAFASGASLRIGQFPSVYDPGLPTVWGLLLTHPVVLETVGHASDNGIELLRHAGISVKAPDSTIQIPAEKISEMDRLLDSMSILKPFAVVHGSSRDIRRTWPPDRIARVIDHISEKYGLAVVITGTAADALDNEEIRHCSRNTNNVTNAAGAFDLSQIPALLASARFLLTIDTGPMHIAAALNTPLVALFRPRHAAIHYPYGQREHIVIADESGLAESITQPLSQISVDEVIDLVDKVILESEKNQSRTLIDATVQKRR